MRLIVNILAVIGGITVAALLALAGLILSWEIELRRNEAQLEDETVEVPVS
ncbi:hypothetical protein Tter_1050 [Thermobaculum terrenum ATCC BAA-798]|uniref:Uncharacterized protein n=1 Tax=Thermobaculum terrenum (strain ATCC BAA-798 / CCMEE 7001 / YNP1) TaxID=525904 RepID=D1CGB0_THET1|nr:hypothetical protein [Thermobaculum terrenum]ACZ41966.1 hypothetical protein Tter_1050 [Thermobaculum terrenum ATCC BAA-798]